MQGKKVIQLAVTVLIPVCAGMCSEGPCGRGQFLNHTSNSCSPCRDGSYMPLENHSCISCAPCDKPRRLEIVNRECNSTSNAQISCKPGYYMVSPNVHMARSCAKCKQCKPTEKEDTPCSGHRDRTCSFNNTILPSDETSSVTSKFENVTVATQGYSTAKAVYNSSTSGGGSNVGGEDSGTAQNNTVSYDSYILWGFVMTSLLGIVLVILCKRFICNKRSRQPVQYDDL